ncbi:hypothetical protein ZHAS_00006559 [Anopheles sinensis]|uniref:Uncharacterized protein n=1 Tax=Anopheles sinensis TaxID=74873 RepID=A0A084VMM4_ANOSI|nr:hypothetical protein ZHAS_00006559 [Anopheles sinensis]
MESFAINDSQITASSAHDIGNVGPQHARHCLPLLKDYATQTRKKAQTNPVKPAIHIRSPFNGAHSKPTRNENTMRKQ